jgi:hypothetical protein
MKKYAIIAQIVALMCVAGSMVKAGISALSVISIILLITSLTLNIHEEVRK